MNLELESLYQKPNIIKAIKNKRLLRAHLKKQKSSGLEFIM